MSAVRNDPNTSGREMPPTVWLSSSIKPVAIKPAPRPATKPLLNCCCFVVVFIAVLLLCQRHINITYILLLYLIGGYTILEAEIYRERTRRTGEKSNHRPAKMTPSTPMKIV